LISVGFVDLGTWAECVGGWPMTGRDEALHQGNTLESEGSSDRKK